MCSYLTYLARTTDGEETSVLCFKLVMLWLKYEGIQ
jgi:hypothetical protein